MQFNLRLLMAVCAVLLAGIPLQSTRGSTASSPLYFDMVIDEAHSRLFGTNTAGNTIDVISLDTLSVVSSLSIGAGPTGIDLSPDGKLLAVALRDQAQVVLIDAETMSVAARMTPADLFGLNKPYDVVFGRTNRLYSVGNPSSAGFDFVHVYDVSTATEITRSAEVIRAAPRLAISPNKNFLYVGESLFSPQQITRFNVSTDVLTEVVRAPHGPVAVKTLAVSGDGSKVFSSSGQVWSSNLSTLVKNIFLGNADALEYVPAVDRLYATYWMNAFYQENQPKFLDAFSSQGGPLVWRNSCACDMGVMRANAAGTYLYVSTTDGVKRYTIPSNITQVYAPAAARPVVGITGKVMYKGQPASGVAVILRWFTDGNWMTLNSQVSNADGEYVFINVPALLPGQRFYVRSYNNANPDHLYVWANPLITSYAAGESNRQAPIDVANVELKAPPAYASGLPPVTFSWQPRVASPSDNYELNIYDPHDGDPWFYTNPPLGYVGSFTLQSLPPGMNTHARYAWEMWILRADGGTGISYETRPIVFEPTAMTTAGWNSDQVATQTYPRCVTIKFVDDVPADRACQ